MNILCLICFRSSGDIITWFKPKPDERITSGARKTWRFDPMRSTSCELRTKGLSSDPDPGWNNEGQAFSCRSPFPLNDPNHSRVTGQEMPYGSRPRNIPIITCHNVGKEAQKCPLKNIKEVAAAVLSICQTLKRSRGNAPLEPSGDNACSP